MMLTASMDIVCQSYLCLPFTLPMRTMTRTLGPFLIASFVFLGCFFLTIAAFNDVVICDAVYGSGLVTESCIRAYEQMPSSTARAMLYRTETAEPLPPGYDPNVESLIFPVVYTDPVGTSFVSHVRPNSAIHSCQ